MSKELPSITGIKEQFEMSAEASHDRRAQKAEAQRERRQEFGKNTLRVARNTIGTGLVLGVLGVIGNNALTNNERHQRAVSDIPGQQFIDQGLQNGTIDPSLASHLKKDN